MVKPCQLIKKNFDGRNLFFVGPVLVLHTALARDEAVVGEALLVEADVAEDLLVVWKGAEDLGQLHLLLIYIVYLGEDAG